MKRRQFIANLLFAGGILTVSGLRSELAADPVEEGWELPPDWKQNSKNPPKPPPHPQPTPDPNIEGDVAPPPPPPIMGRICPPRPEPTPRPKKD